MPNSDDEMLAAEYVLGVLPDGERKAFAARFSVDAALRARIQFWEKQLSAFNGAYASANPPPALRGAVHERLFGAEVKTGFWQSLGFWRALSFATIAALALIVAVPYALNPKSQLVSIAELSGETKAVKMAVSYDVATATIRYNRVEGQAATGRDFQLWAIIGKDAPISLGVIPAAASGKFKVPPRLAAGISDAVLAISDEPTGGSPTGQPTGAVLSSGKLIPI